jgi:Domain of unknown function (DUF4253)
MLTFTQAYLGLVPAARSADIPALIGASVAANFLGVAELSAVLRSWEQRFGGRVVAILDGLYVSVGAPPLVWEHAEQLALVHLLLCPDNLTSQPVWTFPSHVDRILGADLWRSGGLRNRLPWDCSMCCSVRCCGACAAGTGFGSQGRRQPNCSLCITRPLCCDAR